ncbi:hypothetical protein [Modicisalibacter sp. MOD 31.J]|uniref:hypothetical protein n=1 Tax=Modicisalibacter sp. MOD 31.J TaxID=2831897 RepID=UPI001CCAA7EA|nr:hypothetical protein [Modicisalibacter sp. MOD 31.J]MBZ9574568.1 hypothetical protein [Modicisalibacter sp. MOD 31.J]
MNIRASWPLKDWEVPRILDGTKTQARLLVKPQPEGARVIALPDGWGFDVVTDRPGQPTRTHGTIRCPHGKPGDRLWGRENYLQLMHGPVTAGDVKYCASLPPSESGQPKNPGWWWRKRPSIHMPHWHSRITLEINSVRVERLQDITEADAVAEGIQPADYARGPIGINLEASCCNNCGQPRRNHIGNAQVCFGGWGTAWDGETAKGGYAYQWEQTHGLGAWSANPWVWVLEFWLIGHCAAVAPRSSLMPGALP